jgi:hypothetical protein
MVWGGQSIKGAYENVVGAISKYIMRASAFRLILASTAAMKMRTR